MVFLPRQCFALGGFFPRVSRRTARTTPGGGGIANHPQAKQFQILIHRATSIGEKRPSRTPAMALSRRVNGSRNIMSPGFAK